ncbi:hypothetical protein M433DRAFT_998 [Acidomyces richmondensis BFW]|nr:MAG: hypothetical protein FE78DRAFT_33738 [Acidomyces sp. 'richmondensis']KYG49611.1 hypothetical protein M433DRAFT_998 [Acidomyces richmondensis BFW]
MSSAEAQVVYNSGRRFSVPDALQENFAQQYDLAHPEKAMSSYQRLMHQHTKQQYESAAISARRRSSPNSGGAMMALTPESSAESTS